MRHFHYARNALVYHVKAGIVRYAYALLRRGGCQFFLRLQGFAKHGGEAEPVRFQRRPCVQVAEVVIHAPAGYYGSVKVLAIQYHRVAADSRFCHAREPHSVPSERIKYNVPPVVVSQASNERRLDAELGESG